MTTFNESPIILVGMHRSGTTMLSKFIDDIGLFTGVKKEENNESIFFIKVNDWILEQYNASWDSVSNYAYSTPYIKERLITALDKTLNSVRAVEFLGLENYLRYHGISNISIPWGWKDPRTSITLDIWLKLFPKAKIIHIYRNPIDVANSLHTREIKNEKNPIKGIKVTIKERLLLGSARYYQSIKCRNIEEGVKLWIDYASHISQYRSLLFDESELSNRWLDIKYEDFLDDPKPTIQELTKFTGLQASDDTEKKFIDGLDASRKFAFLGMPELEALYLKYKENPLFKSFGYDSII